MKTRVFSLAAVLCLSAVLVSAGDDPNTSSDLGKPPDPPAGAGEPAKTKGKVIKVDHLTVEALVSANTTLGDGEEFTILVQNTLPDRFKYELQAVKLLPKSSLGESAPVLSDKAVFGVHRKEYGGYLLRVTSADGKPVAVPGTQDETLSDFTLMLGVATAGWDIETAGAFTVSGLTDPQFFVDGDKNVRENSDARDLARLGVGAFVHLSHNRHPRTALSFGIAINDSGRTTYFLGPSWRLGGKAFLTAGIAAGAVNRLPNGLALGEAATDANALGTLPTRTSWNAFVGFSYSFLGGADAQLKKPFEAPAPKAADKGKGNQ